VIFIGDTNGELARLVTWHSFGLALALGAVATLADVLQQWSNAPAMIAEMGVRATALHPGARS
jgi:hypothetical protein